jgi:hypothetical protein
VRPSRVAWAAGAASRIALVALAALVVISVFAVGATAAGCSKETGSLVGTWTSGEQGETLDFRADGTLYFTRADGTVDTLRWQADDRNLAIAAGDGKTERVAYSIKGDVLKLTYEGAGSAEYQRLALEGD